MESGPVDKNEALFLQLVLTFQSAAWQQMGKVKNPITDKIEKNLSQARFSIDILEMLKVKSKGNLSTKEEQYLNAAIRELQLNFVEEYDKEQKERAAQTEEPTASESPKEKKEVTKEKKTASGKNKTETKTQKKTKKKSTTKKKT
jgi:hypothetical protein